MKTKFNIEYLPMLAAFAAKQDVRYYLNGFHVKPHPEKGDIWGYGKEAAAAVRAAAAQLPIIKQEDAAC